MKRAFLYASIASTILILFTANSVQASGYADSINWTYTVATNATEILGANNQESCWLGTDENNTGAIMVGISGEFQSGPGNDIIVYGYDLDQTPEQYAVYFGRWDPPRSPIICTAEPIGYAYDTNGTVGFEMGYHSGSFNMVWLVAITGGSGAYPGPEIDAIEGVW